MTAKHFSIILFIIICIGGAILIPNSSAFEKNPPKISILNASNNTIYWNPKNPLNIQIIDDSGLASVSGSIANENAQANLKINYEQGQKELKFELKMPQNLKYKNGDEFTLKLNATDISYANFFSANTSELSAKIIIDTKMPSISIINQSYKIIKGGAGVAVFRLNDDSQLKEFFVQTNYGKRFKPVKFYKDGYYAIMLAWPSKEKDFNAKIIATDLAGNTAKTNIRYFLQDRKYKESKIALRDNFINGKITELAQMYAQNADNMDSIEKFKFVNEILRGANEDKIEQISSNISEESLENFKIKPFYPLKNAAAVASFGDHRYFMLDGSELSQSWHLGLDLASTAGAKITASNDGVVVFAEENGIYGQNLIIYHGFGLYSLYGHCSTLNVDVNSKVKAGDVIATTGATGLALGDHLHFSMIVQGIQVRPEEWMDKKWMKESVYDVLNDAKKIIDTIKK